MYTRCARRFPFVAAAEVQGADGVRPAQVHDLSITGASLEMADPFAKGASVRVKVRTKRDFFQADATVMNCRDAGIGVLFHAVSPPFLIILQRWLSEAQEAAPKTASEKIHT